MHILAKVNYGGRIMLGSLSCCAMCNTKPKYIVENLAVGTRVFCSENVMLCIWDYQLEVMDIMDW